MKKIILYLGIVFTYYVSIRFINSSLNQDDFNFIHFNTISQQALSHHHSEMISLTNISYILPWTVITLFIATIIFYTIYSFRIDGVNQVKINQYQLQLETEFDYSKCLNIKENLYQDSLHQLQARIQIIEADLNSLALEPTENHFKIKLNVIQVMTQQLLQILKISS